MTKTFLAQPYKTYQERLCFEKEQALLPATQIVIEECDRIVRVQQEINALKMEWTQNSTRVEIQKELNEHYAISDAAEEVRLRKEWQTTLLHKCSNHPNNEEAKLANQLFEVAQQNYAKLIARRKTQDKTVREIRRKIKDWDNSPSQIQLTQKIQDLKLSLKPEAQPLRKQFIRRCGNAGDCRGFLSSQWKCGMCNQSTCNACHLVKQQGHVCDPNDVETAKLLATDSKPCPKCATIICKIDGCDQMWCTQCHTAFSWTRGTIQTTIHNPHYYEWMRRNGTQERQAGEIQCGRELTEHLFPTGLDYYDKAASVRFYKVLINTIHIRHVIVPTYATDNVINNESLRIKYMRKQIDETTFKVHLQRASKRDDKKKEIHGILSMYIQSITDILYRCKHAFEQIPNFATTETGKMKQAEQASIQIPLLNSVLDEIEPMTQYVNECLKEVSQTYSCIDMQIILHAFVTDKKQKTLAPHLAIDSPIDPDHLFPVRYNV
jgi:hypothetical protein